MTFARILGITVATAVIVFLGLTVLAPKRHVETAQTAGVVTPDQVFGASATPPAPGETPAATPPPTASNPAAPAATAPAAPTETASSTAPAADASAPAAAPAESSPSAAGSAPQGLSDADARKIAEDVGRKADTPAADDKAAAPAPSSDSAPSASAPSAPSSSPSAAPEPASASASPSSASPSASSSTDTTSGLTESDVRRIAAEEARRVYSQQGGSPSHSSKKAKSSPASDATPSDASAPATTTESASAPAASEAPASKPAKSKKSKKAAAALPNGLPPATDAITAWWLTTDKQAPDHFNLVYAGSAATEKSAVLLFSDPVDAAAASSHLQLFDTDGKPVSGSWEASPSNPRMLLFKNLSVGRYSVVIAPEITSAAGKTITSGLHGPIYIR